MVLKGMKIAKRWDVRLKACSSLGGNIYNKSKVIGRLPAGFWAQEGLEGTPQGCVWLESSQLMSWLSLPEGIVL